MFTSKIAGRKWLFIVIILVVLGVSVGVVIWMFSGGTLPEPFPQNTPPSSLAPTTSTLVGQPSSAGMETYTNTEFGFEFQYPKDLVIEENSFVSYYSKFNLKLFTKIGESFDSTFLVNIVLPEFAERSFGGLDKTTTEVVIDGVSGVKYQYEFSNRQETAIILPLGEYQLVLAVYYEEYEDIFNQILASFKFL